MKFFNRDIALSPYAPFMLAAAAGSITTLLLQRLFMQQKGHDWNDLGQKRGQQVIKRTMEDYIGFLSSAQHEIVQIPRYVGQWLSGDNVVSNHLIQHLEKGKKLKIIALDPSGDEAKSLPDADYIKLTTYINALIKLKATYPDRVEIRCTPRFSPYAMDLIDCDLANDTPMLPTHAKLNLQPKPTREPHKLLPNSLTQDPVNQKNTWIFPLENIPGAAATPFKSYRDGARAIWRDARPILSAEDILVDSTNNVIVLS
ncbi:MAG: hypothetical protein NTW08_09890 [Gammaproteobacteria bacterium]|nr:hypothetical protein [Gammaproteobacteria bacterium]